MILPFLLRNKRLHGQFLFRFCDDRGDLLHRGAHGGRRDCGARRGRVRPEHTAKWQSMKEE